MFKGTENVDFSEELSGNMVIILCWSLCKGKCQKIPIDLHTHRILLVVLTCKKIKGIRSRALPSILNFLVRVRRHTHNLCGDLLEMCVLATAAIGRKAVSVEILPTKYI